MLITTCTHCLARFRVTPQQLNLKQGQVRCGRCGKVFSGFEALERFPDDDTGARLLAAREAARPSEPLPEQSPVGVELPDLGAPEPPQAATAAGHGEPGEEAVRAPAPAAAPSAAMTPSAPSRRKVTLPLELQEEPAAPRRRVSALWSVGCVTLVVALAAELAYAFRVPLAQGYPPLRPWLQAACTRVGCTVGWSREERLLKLEDSELLEVPGKPGEIQLGARVRNLAPVPQEYPFLELTLTDVGGQAAARRVLRPGDYLGRAPAPDEALAAGSDITLQLRLATPRIHATGYELLLFYP